MHIVIFTVIVIFNLILQITLYVESIIPSGMNLFVVQNNIFKKKVEL